MRQIIIVSIPRWVKIEAPPSFRALWDLFIFGFCSACVLGFKVPAELCRREWTMSTTGNKIQLPRTVLPNKRSENTPAMKSMRADDCSGESLYHVIDGYSFATSSTSFLKPITDFLPAIYSINGHFVFYSKFLSVIWKILYTLLKNITNST